MKGTACVAGRFRRRSRVAPVMHRATIAPRAITARTTRTACGRKEDACAPIILNQPSSLSLPCGVGRNITATRRYNPRADLFRSVPPTRSLSSAVNSDFIIHGAPCFVRSVGEPPNGRYDLWPLPLFVVTTVGRAGVYFARIRARDTSLARLT